MVEASGVRLQASGAGNRARPALSDSADSSDERQGTSGKTKTGGNADEWTAPKAGQSEGARSGLSLGNPQLGFLRAWTPVTVSERYSAGRRSSKSRTRPRKRGM